MTIRWNGLDAGLAPGLAALLTSRVEPLSDTYVVQQGFRSIVQQNAAYSLGRDAAGNVIDRSKVVTNARGGESPHNYGLAIDLYPIVGGAIDYGFNAQGQSEPNEAAFPAWAALWNAIESTGNLVSGRTFQLISGYDPGHVELKNWKLFVNTPVPAEATAVGAGGSGTPSQGGSTPPGGPSASDALASTVASWFEIDSGVAIGMAAIVGLLVMLALRSHRGH